MALDQHSAEVLAARARVYYAQKDYGQAVRYAQSAIERKADCEGAYNVLGRALFASDRPEEAAALVDRAIEVSGDDYNTFIPYINALTRLDRSAKVADVKGRMLAALERQLELVPEDVRARILLANMLPAFGRGEDAARQLETAVALRPNDGNVLYNAACTYALMGRRDAAVEMFRKALDAGYGNREWAARDPDFASLRDDPEFRRLCGLDAR